VNPGARVALLIAACFGYAVSPTPFPLHSDANIVSRLANIPSKGNEHGSITSSDEELVLSSLEPEQPAGLKKRLIPRRHLSGLGVFVMWSLRVYLLFMMAVVIYQVLNSPH
jgi:hypothetical protein